MTVAEIRCFTKKGEKSLTGHDKKKGLTGLTQRNETEAQPEINRCTRKPGFAPYSPLSVLKPWMAGFSLPLVLSSALAELPEFLVVAVLECRLRRDSSLFLSVSTASSPARRCLGASVASVQ
ncbi:hypothetical protein HN51_041447 [Arachis hypogaea]